MLHTLSNSFIVNSHSDLRAQFTFFIIRALHERLLRALLLVPTVEVLSNAEEEPGKKDEGDVNGVSLEPSWTCIKE